MLLKHDSVSAEMAETGLLRPAPGSLKSGDFFLSLLYPIELFLQGAPGKRRHRFRFRSCSLDMRSGMCGGEGRARYPETSVNELRKGGLYGVSGGGGEASLFNVKCGL